MPSLPPLKNRDFQNKWNFHKKSWLHKSYQYLLTLLTPSITKVLKLHPQTIKILQRSFNLGNPSQTIWPSDVMPMVSRLVVGGLWNYSFFQFHRYFYFPYWVQEQYNPTAKSFIPRSHNVLSMNQSHRNWVSISFPGKPNEVSVDPALAIMPELDSYTIEFAIIKNNKLLRPHDEVDKVEIIIKELGHLQCQWQNLTIHIIAKQNGVHIYTENKNIEDTSLQTDNGIIFSIRPFNMEGVSFIDELRIHQKNNILEVQGDVVHLTLKNPTIKYYLGSYLIGDSLKLLEKTIIKNKIYPHQKNIKDKMGLSNASFYYENSNDLDIMIWDTKKFTPPHGLVRNNTPNSLGEYDANSIWNSWFPLLSTAQLPKKYNELYQHVTKHLLTLWDYQSITPGSFTYHHFWIRDATVILYALNNIGGEQAVREILYTFHNKVSRKGLFQSQAGEWDANGQALWIIGQFIEYSNDMDLLQHLLPQINKMLQWIQRIIHINQGVMPPGFSAEHLGVADWYLWDNFWTLGGIKALLPLQKYIPKINLQSLYNEIHTKLELYLNNYKYYPAALARRKDAGMIGSISAVYPLNLPEYFNQKMLNSIEIIYKNYFFDGGFFQDNIHSGINPYLTLQVAECFLKLGRTKKANKILSNIFKWSSVGYSFPEAAHPYTKSGCMGDGFHGWAFAESILLLQNLFFLENPDKLIFMAGIYPSWLLEKINISMNSIYTKYGVITLSVLNGILSVSGFKNRTSIENHIYLAIPHTFSLEAIKSISGCEILSLENHLWSFDYGDRILIKLSINETDFKIKILD